MPMFQKKGSCIILSAPSGTGKSSLSRALLGRFPSTLTLSISATTRAPRPNEIQGQDYHFMSTQEFEETSARGDFVEEAHIYGHRYGTLKAPLLKNLERGCNVLFDIDWQGAQRLRASSTLRCVTIFLLPPSREALEERLKKRKQDSPEVISRRMAQLKTDLAHAKEYDYIVVNDIFDQTLATLEIILHAENFSRTSIINLDEKISALL